MGQATEVRLLDRRLEAATPEMARDLEVEDGAPVVRCQRLRLFQGEPYCYIVNTLPEEIGQRIEPRRWEKGSVLQYIEDELGIPLREAQQNLRATLADPPLARWLEVRIGAPLLRVDYLIRTDKGRPVEAARLYYRADLYRFTLRLKRTPGPSKDSPWALRDHRLER
jgi:GntR family transcriptional regulator